MARAYTVATAALALGVSSKWLDNALSHHQVSGVDQARQGISRRLSLEGLLLLKLSLNLIRDFGIPVGKAIKISESIIQMGGQVTSPSGVVIQVHLDQIKSQVEVALEAAVEVAPTPNRGRPPKNKTGRLS